MRLAFTPPMLPTLVEEPPEGREWIHEIKYDGYRTQVLVQDGKARLFTRNGFDWTEKYAPIAAAVEALGIDCAIIDGEMIVTDDEGKPNFGQLRAAIRNAPESLRFVAFDLLHLHDHDLRGMATIERRHLLEDLLHGAPEPLRFSEHVDLPARDFYQAVDGLGLEGMVSKLADAPYVSGRSRSWLKIKCYEESDLEVAGVLRQPGEAPMALMVTPGERRYVGGAFISLNRQMRERLWKRVQAGAGSPPKGLKKPNAEWVKPGMIGRVRYLKGEEKLRHARLIDIATGTPKKLGGLREEDG